MGSDLAAQETARDVRRYACREPFFPCNLTYVAATHGAAVGLFEELYLELPSRAVQQ